MKRLIVGAIFFVVFLPQFALADVSKTAQQHIDEINQVAAKIVGSNFEPLTLTVQADSLTDAFLDAARVVRNHVDTCLAGSKICEFRKLSPIVSDQEYTLLKKDYSVSKAKNSKEHIEVVIKVDKAQLVQMALFGIWPMIRANHNE